MATFAFAVLTVDGGNILDSITVDDDGEVSYDTGASERLVRSVAGLDADPDSDDIVEALDGWSNGYLQIVAEDNLGQTAAVRFDETKIKRDRGGKFAKTAGLAITEALKSGQPDALAPFTREQLRKEAKRRNLTVPRNASIDVIKSLLRNDESSDPSGVDTPAGAPAAVGDVVRQLQTATARDETKVRGLLDDLSKEDLNQIARQMDTVPNLPKGASRQRHIDAILEGSVGFRQRAQAIGRPEQPSRAAEMPAVPDRDTDATPARRRVRRAPERSGPSTRSAMTDLDVPALVQALEGVTADDEATVRGALEGRPRAELAQIARQLPTVASPGSKSRAQILDDILEGTVGFRRRAEAIGGWGRQTAATDSSDETAFQGRMPEDLAEYWVHGAGATRIRWGSRGAYRRCQRALRREGVPTRMIDGACANLYHRATGRWPGRKRGEHAMALVNQTACGCHTPAEPAMNTGDGCPPGAHRMPDGSCMPDHEMPTNYDLTDPPAGTNAPSTSDGWRGPLAPIDIATGDRRRFANGALASRQLPLPFRWQERQERGHDGAVVVGALTGYTMGEDGIIHAEGYFLDETIIPEVRKAKHLVEHGLIGPSVDLEPAMQVMYRDAETGHEFDPQTCDADGSCPTVGESVITAATIAGATLVPITAFAEARAPEIFNRTLADDQALLAAAAAPVAECGCHQTAAVRTAGWDDMPIAAREREWDKDTADARVTAWARAENLPVDEAEIDWARYGRAFLWHDEPADTKTAFKLPIADIIDGELTIVPRAVFAAAGRLDSAIIPSADKTRLRDVIEDLYDQMAEEFDDDTVHAPWDRPHEMSSGAAADCGCAEKWANQTAAAGKYGVFGDMEPYPAEAFDVQATELTPMTVTEDGRVYGHAFSWRSCNRGYRNMCLPPPRSHTGYSQFHLGAVRTTKGNVPVGKIVMGEGHPDLNFGMKITRAFYDATSKTVAIGRIKEDKWGGMFSGVLAPGVTPEEATMFFASPPSGDWRDHELIAVLAVNVPGHVVPRAQLVDGQPVNMVAAGRYLPDTQDDETAVLEHELLTTTFAVLADDLWADEAATLAAAFAN